MQKSNIEWTNYTANPVKGLCPVACPYCYSRKMYKRFNLNEQGAINPQWDYAIRFDMGAFDGIEKIKKPSRIFVGSMMELFGDWVEPSWMEDIFDLAKVYKQHTFIFLTKKPENLHKYSPFPDNCWVGASCTDNYDIINRIGYLSLSGAKVKFLSIEPLLGWDKFTSPLALRYLPLVNWLIIGQQTPVSDKTKPKMGWMRSIITAANAANIPIFLKDNILDDPALDFRLNEMRQEFPMRVTIDEVGKAAKRQKEFENVSIAVDTDNDCAPD